MKKRISSLIVAVLLVLTGAGLMAYAAAVSQVTGLTATQSGSDELTVSWNAQSDADGYSVYMATGSANASYTCLASVGGTSYTKKKLMVGTAYYFKVRAYRLQADGATKSFGTFSASVGMTVKAERPQITSVLSEQTGVLTVRWNALPKADGYSVYYASSQNGTYTCLASTTQTYFNKKLTLGQTGYFKVRAYTLTDGKKTFTPFSDVVKGYCTAGVPRIVNVTSQGSGKLKVAWEALEGADGYSLYMSESRDGVYSCLTGTTGTAFTKSGLTAGKSYYFKVRAYVTPLGSKIFGAFSETVQAVAAPKQPVLSSVVTSGQNQITVSWNKNSDAAGYSIYMATSRDGAYTCLSSTTGNAYTKKNLTMGSTYYFKVRAYAMNGSSKVFSQFSDIQECLCGLEAPSLTSVTSAGSGKLRVAWNPVTGADGYSVYMAESRDGSYTCLTSVTGTEYTRSNLTSGKDYFFKVRAYRMQNGQKVFSAFSDVSEATANLKTPVISSVTASASKALTVTWNYVKNADGYSVYMAYSKDGTYSCMASVTGTSYTKTKLQPNTTCYFKVRPYLLYNGSKVFGSFSAVVSGKAVLGAPEIDVSAGRDGTMAVTWGKIDGADGYSIYMAPEISGTYTCLASTASERFTKSGLNGGAAYLFKVRSYSLKADGTKVFSAFSAPVRGVCPLTTPMIYGFRSTGDGELQATWSAIPDASGYRLYLSDQKNGVYELAASTEQPSFLFHDLVPGATYYLKVVPCYEEGGATTEGKESVPVSGVFEATDTLHLTTEGTTSGKIHLAWDAVSAVDGYSVYMSDSGVYGDYVCISSVTGNTCDRAGLEAGRAYYFKVRPYTLNGTARRFGDYSYPAKGLCGMDKASMRMPVSGEGGAVSLSWGEVRQAQYYEVQAAQGSDAAFRTVAPRVKDTECTVTGLSNAVWRFRVRAYYYYGDETVCGAWSEERTGCPGLDAPVINSVEQAATGQLTVSWSPVSGAEGYSLSMADSQDGEYISIASTEATSYTKVNLTVGGTYFFKVRAYYVPGGTKVFSEFSAFASGTTGLTGGGITDVLYLNGEGLRVSWVNPAGATGAIVYRRQPGDTAWIAVKELSDGETSWVDTSVASGESYSYGVRAVCDNASGRTVSGGEMTEMTVTAEPPVYHVDHTTLPLFGAYTTDERYNADSNAFFAVRSYLDRLDEAGGGTLVVGSGDYMLYGAWYISSNVHVILEDGVRLLRNGNSSWFEFVSQRDLTNGVLYSGFNGVHDASLTCPVPGGAKLMDGERGVALVIIHTRHILLDGLTFVGSTGNQHNIELDGSIDVEIKNCVFEGTADETDIGLAKEAINLDIPDVNLGGVVCRYTTYDKTATKDIYIHHNTFRNQLVGVGSHMYTDVSPHTNIRIEDNLFDNTVYHAIGADNWVHTVIKGNIFRNCGRVKTDESGSRYAMLLLDGAKDTIIQNNTFSGGAYFVSFRVSQYSEEKSDVLRAYTKIPSVLTDEEKAMIYGSNVIENVEYPYIFWYNEDYSFTVIRSDEGGAPAFTVTPDSEPYYKKYTAANTPNYNDKTACYYMLRSYLEALEHVGGGTLTLGRGTYDVTNVLYIPSDVSLVLEEGAVLRKATDTGTSGMTATNELLCFLNPSQSASLGTLEDYGGCTNAGMTGGTIDMNGVSGNAVAMPQSCNVSVKDVEFRNIGNSRYVSVNSAKDVTIENCRFYHLEGSASRGVTVSTKYNNAPSRNVTVAGCTFDGLGYGVQSGDAVSGVYTENLTVTGCSFLNPTTNALYLNGCKGLVLTDNTFFNGDEELILSGATLTAAFLYGTDSMTVTGNTFEGFTYAMRFHVTDVFPESHITVQDIDGVIQHNVFKDIVNPYLTYVLKKGDASQNRYFVNLTAPNLHTATSTAARNLTLGWDAVDNASGYTVYISDAADGIYNYLAGTSDNGYVSDTMTAGMTYYCKVAGYHMVNGSKVYGPASAPVAVTVMDMDTVTVLSAEADGSNRIRVSWELPDGAAGCNVYMAESEDGSYTCVFGGVTDTSVTKGSLTGAKRYFFKVRPYKTDAAGTKTYAPYSEAVSAIAGPDAVTGLTASPLGTGQILVSWDTSPTATSYELYVQVADESEPAMVLRTGSDIFCVELLENKKYSFRVRPCCMGDDGWVYGNLSGARTSYPGLDQPRNLAVTPESRTLVTLTWDAANGADGYNLYMSETFDGTYTCFASVTDLSYRRGSLEAGKRYYFKVRPYYMSGSSKLFGYDSDVVSAETFA